jgi:hypothetical protein
VRTGTLKTKRELLDEARQKSVCVRIRRSFDDLLGLDAFVVSIGRSWVLLSVVGDGIRLDGWAAIRLTDIAEVVVSPRDEFVREALSLRAELPAPEPPTLRLDGVRPLLVSLREAAPLLTVMTEVEGPFAIAIGRIVEVGRSELVLHEIDPCAEWLPEASRLALSAITRVELGGSYEQALELVAEARERSSAKNG